MSDEHQCLPEIVSDRDKAYAETRILRQDHDGFTIAVPLTEFAAKWWGEGAGCSTAAEENNQLWDHYKDGSLIIMVIPERVDYAKLDAAKQALSATVVEIGWRRFEDLVHAAIMQSGLALEFLPERLRTAEFCRVAVERNAFALRLVPKSLCTPELCKVAVAQDGRTLQWVPKAIRTLELSTIAVSQHGGALIFVPQEYCTLALCTLAVAQNEGALEWVPEHMRAKLVHFVPQKDVLPETITWDISMLDRLQEKPTLPVCMR